MRLVLFRAPGGVRPWLPSEDADLDLVLALLEVKDSALAALADEQGSPINLVQTLLPSRILDVAKLYVVPFLLLAAIFCLHVLRRLERRSPTFGRRGDAFGATRLGRSQRLTSAVSRQRP